MPWNKKIEHPIQLTTKIQNDHSETPSWQSGNGSTQYEVVNLVPDLVLALLSHNVQSLHKKQPTWLFKNLS